MTTQTEPTVEARRDARGVPVTTPFSSAVDALESAVFGLLGHRADTAKALQEALSIDPELALAHCMQGFAYKCLGRRDFESAAWSSLDAARRSLAARGGSARERSIVLALERWCLGDPISALAALHTNLLEHPRDLLGFKLHHALAFMLGQSHALRDASQLSLHALGDRTPGFAYVLGCHAFGLEETGDLRGAEAAGRRAVALQPLDAWGGHAVAHVLESQDRPLAGLSFLDANEAPWASCNNFAGHLAWHRCLFLLQLGHLDEALALCDTRIATYLGRDYRDASNASSLLFRLEQAGMHVGDRWQPLAELARAHIGDHALAFADAHYVLSLARAGDLGTAEHFVRSQRWAARRTDHAARVQAAIGVPLCEGIVALADGRYGDATDSMLPLADSLLRVGGSNAQRDLFALLLIDAAERDERHVLTHSLLQQRLAARPNNRFAREHSHVLAVKRRSAA